MKAVLQSIKGGQVTVREILDLTLAIDHNIVDGAPAARFAAEFRTLVESAAVISPSRTEAERAATAAGLRITRTFA